VISNKKHIRSFLFALVSGISLLALQGTWMFDAYMREYKQIMSALEDAFHQAYQNEQTYRIPVVDILNPGAITIQSCGTEEILIIRKCPEVDTIVYNNISGHSIESFINHVFLDLREQIVPLNIYCLSDLFAGKLYDIGISVAFVIERFDTSTGEVLETSLLPDRKQPEMLSNNVIVSNISDKESIRTIINLTPNIVFMRMKGMLIFSIFFTVVSLTGIIFLYRRQLAMQVIEDKEQVAGQSVHLQNTAFQIGQYQFDPNKNELTGFGESIQLNKKENSILQALCIKQGNVVERNLLLNENWGNLGIVYSRSLDTYLTTLRKYLRKDPTVQIVTIKGVGYKLVC